MEYWKSDGTGGIGGRRYWWQNEKWLWLIPAPVEFIWRYRNQKSFIIISHYRMFLRCRCRCLPFHSRVWHMSPAWHIYLWLFEQHTFHFLNRKTSWEASTTRLITIKWHSVRCVSWRTRNSKLMILTSTKAIGRRCINKSFSVLVCVCACVCVTRLAS